MDLLLLLPILEIKVVIQGRARYREQRPHLTLLAWQLACSPFEPSPHLRRHQSQDSPLLSHPDPAVPDKVARTAERQQPAPTASLKQLRSGGVILRAIRSVMHVGCS